MNDETKRRHSRYPIRLATTMIRGARSHQLFSRDVSHGGLFLHTDFPPPLRELVRIRIVLPNNKDETLELLGMAVHRVEPGGPRSAGVGVNFYGNGPEAKAAWSAFISYLAQTEAPLPAPSAAKPAEPAGPGTKIPDIRPELRVKVRSVDDLTKILARDLEKGRLFVRTELWLERGTRVTIDLVHPETGRVFSIPGQVQTQLQRGDLKGLGVGFEEEPDRAARFEEFLNDEIYVTVDLGCELVAVS